MYFFSFSNFIHTSTHIASDSNQAIVSVDNKKEESGHQEVPAAVATAVAVPINPVTLIDKDIDDDDEEEVEVVAANTKEDIDEDEDGVIVVEPPKQPSPAQQEEPTRQKRSHQQISRADEQYKIKVGDLFGYPAEAQAFWRELKEEVAKGPVVKTSEEAFEWSHGILVKTNTCTRSITAYIGDHFGKERQIRNLLLAHVRARFNVIKAYTDIIVYTRLGDDWKQQQRLAIDSRKDFISNQFEAKTQLLSFMQY